MRALILIPLVALTACSGENQGWNPNYRAEATPYGDYLRAREAALTGERAGPPRIAPVALPARAPTAAQIAGPTPTQILERETTAAAAAVGIVSDRRLPKAKAAAPSLDNAPRVVYPVRRRSADAVVVGTAAPVVTPDSSGASPVVTQPVTAQPLPAPAGRWPRDGSVRGDCSAFATPDGAQKAFITAGGPQRDPLGLDQDGDGRVCGWSPDRGEPL